MFVMVETNKDKILKEVCDILENNPSMALDYLFAETEDMGNALLNDLLMKVCPSIAEIDWKEEISKINVNDIAKILAERELKKANHHEKEQFIDMVRRITEPGQSLFWWIYGYSVRRCLSCSTRRNLIMLTPDESSNEATSHAIEEVNKGYRRLYLIYPYFNTYRKVMNPVECRGRRKRDQKKYLHKVEKKATKIMKQYRSMNKSGEYFSDGKHTVVRKYYSNYSAQLERMRRV